MAVEDICVDHSTCYFLLYFPSVLSLAFLEIPAMEKLELSFEIIIRSNCFMILSNWIFLWEFF